MKNLTMIAIALMMYSCSSSKSNANKAHRNHTPKVYHMSQNEKEDVNYDLRENKKLVATNIKHKVQNQHFAANRREDQQKQLNDLNSTASKNIKVKHVSHQSFCFYH